MDLLTKSVILQKDYNYQITICCLLRTGELAERAKNNNLRVLGPFMNFRYDVFAGFKLRKLFTESKWDIIHSHLFAANFITHSVLRTVPSVQKPQYVVSEHSMANRWSTNKLLLDRWMVNCANIMILPSTASLESYRRMGINQTKLVVVPNSVDVSTFTQNNMYLNRTQTRKALGLSDDDTVLITISRLEAVKNLDLVIKSLQTIDAFWIVVGEGSEKTDLERQAKIAAVDKKILFLGKRSDIPQLLSAADIFILPSKSETFGISIAEALLMGLPVISTNVGGIPEVTREQDYAVLIDPNDKDQLVESINKVIKNIGNYKEKAQQGSVFIRENFSPTVAARKQHEIYQRLL